MVLWRTVRWVIGCVLPLLCSPGVGWAGSLDSFRDAERSSIDYRAMHARPAVSCESLRQRTDYYYTVISTREIKEDAQQPAHCEIHGVIAPEVQFWLYLPAQWNGRFYMLGEGGYAGHAPQDSNSFVTKIAGGLRNGFATAFTNTGHDAAYEPLGTFAYNELQKTLDFAYRAVHLTALISKEIITLYYNSAPRFSYFDGCSTGGRQGLMSAQRFPQGFDGIAAGAPVNAFTDLHIWMAWIYQALDKTPIAANRVTEILAPNVLRVCDARDGAKDGLIQNPRECPFDPKKDLPMCDGGGAQCFSPVEIETLTRLYGPVLSKGKAFFPGLQVGVEPVGALVLRGPKKQAAPVGTGWLEYLITENGTPGQMKAFADTFFKYLAFPKDDPTYDWRTLNFDTDLERLERVRSLVDATATNMSAFAKRGKILSYHGWADGGPPAAFTVKYYEDVLSDMGEQQTKAFYRLFMVPGMFHCDGGYGPTQFDVMTPLINWVERGTTPESIAAQQMRDGQLVRGRPLCPYPKISGYQGSGDMNAAANFKCVPP